MASVKNNS